MSDPLLDFLLSRDREKVLAEARPVPLERLYAEASIEDRELLEALPIGVLRRRIIEAETRPVRKTRVVGNRDLLRAVRLQKERADRLESQLEESRGWVADLQSKLAAKSERKSA